MPTEEFLLQGQEGCVCREDIAQGVHGFLRGVKQGGTCGLEGCLPQRRGQRSQDMSTFKRNLVSKFSILRDNSSFVLYLVQISKLYWRAKERVVLFQMLKF